jgi:ubiquitin-protein ligase
MEEELLHCYLCNEMIAVDAYEDHAVDCLNTCMDSDSTPSSFSLRGSTGSPSSSSPDEKGEEEEKETRVLKEREGVRKNETLESLSRARLFSFSTPLRLSCARCTQAQSAALYGPHIAKCFAIDDADGIQDRRQHWSNCESKAACDCCDGKSSTGDNDGKSSTDGNDNDGNSLLRALVHCSHRVCFGCVDAELKPPESGACSLRAMLQRWRCPVSTCRCALAPGDVVATIGRPLYFHLSDAAVHELTSNAALVKKTRKWNCSACLHGSALATPPPTNKQAIPVAECAHDQGKVTMTHYASQMLVTCSRCDTPACLACLQAHGDSGGVCAEARSLIALRTIAFLSNAVGVTRDGRVRARRSKKQAAASSSSNAAVFDDDDDGEDSSLWVSGVGYGYSGRSNTSNYVWDPLAREAGRQRADKKLARFFGVLLACLETRRHSDGGDDDAATPMPAALLFVCRYNALLPPLLRALLNNDSLTDVVSRSNVFEPVFGLIGLFSRTPGLRVVLRRQATSNTPSIAELVGRLQSKAAHMRRLVADGEAEQRKASQRLVDMLSSIATEFASAGREDTTADGAENLGASPSSAAASSSASPAAASSSPATYASAMAPLQFGEIDLVSHASYKYREDALEQKLPKRVLRAAFRQLDAVSTPSLICSGKTAVCVRVDKTRLNCWRALITGAPDTPYAYGAFLVDIFLDKEFPNKPPKCWSATTGYGSQRFSPNAYDNGKLCLSLLGTWPGDAAEQWQPKSSSIFQVLLSIQSMIFGVTMPYFNEPGFEGEMHTTMGQQRSAAYSSERVIMTLRWALIEHLKSPATYSHGFEDAIHAHIEHCCDDILAHYYQWASKSSAATASVLKEAISEFKTLWKQVSGK